MRRLAQGTFQIRRAPLPPALEDAGLGRHSLDKVFSGDLEATSHGEMLSAMGTVPGSAGYVALERVTGSLFGRRGSFVLQHSGTMDRGTPGLVVTVVPDSGADALAGLSGTMRIVADRGAHSYEFDCELPKHLTMDELITGLAEAGSSPSDAGRVELIVRRPAIGARDVVEHADLDPAVGVVGDNWKERGSSRTQDGTAHPEMQVNVMNSRVVNLIATSRDRWPLAGDQLFVDFELSEANVPPGTHLALGTAVLEVTAEPHTGCGKFVSRFGLDAMKFVNSPDGRARRLRGLNAKVIEAGRVRVGDVVSKI